MGGAGGAAGASELAFEGRGGGSVLCVGAATTHISVRYLAGKAAVLTRFDRWQPPADRRWCCHLKRCQWCGRYSWLPVDRQVVLMQFSSCGLGCLVLLAGNRP